MKLLLPFFIIIPALEIGIFLWAGNEIGIFSTILLIIITGIVGAALAKRQGIEALQNARRQIQLGTPPQEVILDGICILAGGLLLLMPGFLTDAIGLALLLPPTRKFAKKILIKWIKHRIDKNSITIIR